MSRQSISKRTRFNIFKRDGFTCQYCGARIRGSRHQFRYFCKVCWNKISALEGSTG